METIRIKRIRLLDVPVDSINQDYALKVVERFLIDQQQHQIVFLDRRKLFKARRNAEFRRCLRDASLILPISKSVVRGARFLRKSNLSLYDPFAFVIRLLAVVERLSKTVYLLGARKEDLERAERNLRDSFPGLRLVGRFSGYFPKEIRKNVLLGVKKASPSLLIVGHGLEGQDLWILRHKTELNPGIYLWAGDSFDRFSGKKSRSGFAFWKIFLVFPVLYYWIILVFSKVFQR